MSSGSETAQDELQQPLGEPRSPERQFSLGGPHRVVLFGVANERSIAWAIAQKLHQAGAQLALSYLDERAARRVEPLAASIGAYTAPCDLRERGARQRFLSDAAHALGGSFDGLVHSVAFARREDLQRPLHEVEEEGFQEAFAASVTTFPRLCGDALPHLAEGASILTLSYLGARRFIPGYQLMGPMKAALEASLRNLAVELGERGLRVNGISSGPLRTLSAAAIPGLRGLLRTQAQHNALRRPLRAEEVAAAALFLLSPLSSAITGELLHVDCGEHLLGPYPFQP